MFIKRLTIIFLVFTLIYGCARNDSEYKLPGVYRVNIQQGNVIEQENLDRLRPGMDKEQVLYIMGTPAIKDPFHTDRWDYIYTFTQGANRRQQQHITLLFEEDKLTEIIGDVVAGTRKTSEELTRETTTVDVPERRVQTRKGFFGRIAEAIPFIGDEDETPPPPKSAEQDEESTEEPEE